MLNFAEETRFVRRQRIDHPDDFLSLTVIVEIIEILIESAEFERTETFVEP